MLRSRLATLAAAVAALAVPTTATAAATPASEMAPESALLLSVSPGEHPLPTADETLLLCQPAGGTHPGASKACAQLTTAAGEVSDVSFVSQRPCVLIYAPVTVTADGVWRGEPVHYAETFTNTCMLHASKGAVFQF